MKLISPRLTGQIPYRKTNYQPGPRPLKTEFQAIFLSGTVQEDNGNRVTVWTDDSRTFHVPHEYITEIQDPNDPFTYEFPNTAPSPTVSFDEIISVL